VLFPRAAGVLSALGGQHCDIVREVSAPHATSSRDFDFAGVASTLALLRERLAAFAADLPRALAGEVSTRYFVEARYAHQVWDLAIPVEEEGVPDDAALARLVERFGEAHERIFAVREPGQRIELSQWRGRVAVVTDKPRVDAARRPAPGAAAHARRAFFPELGEIEVPVHLGGDLAPGAIVDGPALLVEPETTIVIYPGWQAAVTAHGNYMLAATT
jgi:N-methylhydantoinase A